MYTSFFKLERYGSFKAKENEDRMSIFKTSVKIFHRFTDLPACRKITQATIAGGERVSPLRNLVFKHDWPN